MDPRTSNLLGRHARYSILLALPFVLWIVLGSLFILHTPIDSYQHDFTAQTDNTRYLILENRLYRPHESLEGQQVPLYYLIASRIVPLGGFHVFWVRQLSVIFGAAFLGTALFLMRSFAITPAALSVTLLFLATTPNFIFTFVSYNNDSLVAT